MGLSTCLWCSLQQSLSRRFVSGSYISSVNVKKCKMVCITLKKQPFRSSLTLSGSVLEEVYEFRDFGLLTNHHLAWTSHVDAITNKANRTLGLLSRTCRGWYRNPEGAVLHVSEIGSGIGISSVVSIHRTKR